MPNNFPQPERVLLIVAHPDDPEFGAAGTIARWVQGGAHVTFVIVTDGSKGTADKEMTKEKLVVMREAEQRAAAAVLGVQEVVFLGQPDGEIQNTYALRELIVRQIRTHRPDVLITHDPTTRIFQNMTLNHTDHRVVGDTVLDAVFPLARDRMNFPEHEAAGLEPHKVLDIFLQYTENPNYWVDISATMDLKIKALCEHKSQIGEPAELEERLRQRHGERAEHVSFEYAETFRRVKLAG